MNELLLNDGKPIAVGATGTAVAPPLLEIEDLQTHFFTAAGTVRAVDGVSYSGARRRDAGRRRRERLRQERNGAVDPAARRGPARADRRRRDPLRRRQSAGAERRRDGGHSRQRDLDDLPGADDLAEPADDDRPPDRRSHGAAPGRAAPRGDGPGDRDAAPRPHPGGGAPRARLPAPAFGRHAAARDDRDGACRATRSC